MLSCVAEVVFHLLGVACGIPKGIIAVAVQDAAGIVRQFCDIPMGIVKVEVQATLAIFLSNCLILHAGKAVCFMQSDHLKKAKPQFNLQLLPYEHTKFNLDVVLNIGNHEFLS